MNNTRIIILGAGPAGVGAAWRLRVEDRASAVVLEQRGDAGGNAGSFEIEGIPVDYGSHRLHPACRPDILADVRGLLGDDLLDRPRHGRILLHGRWIHFPLRPLDLLLASPLSFKLGVAADSVRKIIPSAAGGNHESFASVLERGLGRTICRDFYFPYAIKIWGRSPQELSAIQARRRVAAGSLYKLLKKVLRAVPGLRPAGAGRFFYPRGGFGQISRAVADAAVRRGARIQFNARVTAVRLGRPHRVDYECDGRAESIEADHVWSTIPISLLARMISPAAPAAVQEAANGIAFRSMILVYVVLGQRQFTPFDAHYLPGADVPFTRISEPRNYSVRSSPPDRTVLCGELPCSTSDAVWRASDQELGDLLCDSLRRCGLPVQMPAVGVVTRRLAHAYPIYATGYERHFNLLDEWVEQLERVLTFGRQGLFAHDNTHHALAMAYSAVECLRPGGEFDAAAWQRHRQEFTSHVVED